MFFEQVDESCDNVDDKVFNSSSGFLDQFHY